VATFNPSCIDRHRDELRAGGPQRATRAEVAGLLDGDAVVRLEQRRCREPQRRLRSGDDEHLIGDAPHRPRRTEMLGDRDAKAAHSRRVAVRQLFCRLRAHLASDELRPRRMREEIERGESDLIRNDREVPVRRRRLIGDGALAERRARPRRWWRRATDRRRP
jgi:hypothetical protein